MEHKGEQSDQIEYRDRATEYQTNHYCNDCLGVLVVKLVFRACMHIDVIKHVIIYLRITIINEPPLIPPHTMKKDKSYCIINNWLESKKDHGGYNLLANLRVPFTVKVSVPAIKRGQVSLLEINSNKNGQTNHIKHGAHDY